jgi:hypothetical protein
VNPLPKATIGYQNHFFEKELTSMVPNPAKYRSMYSTPAVGISNLNNPKKGTQSTFNSNLGGGPSTPQGILIPPNINSIN